MEDESFKNFMSNLGENDKSLYHLLCEKCPNMEFFLVHISLYLD